MMTRLTSALLLSGLLAAAPAALAERPRARVVTAPPVGEYHGTYQYRDRPVQVILRLDNSKFFINQTGFIRFMAPMFCDVELTYSTTHFTGDHDYAIRRAVGTCPPAARGTIRLEPDGAALNLVSVTGGYMRIRLNPVSTR